jgi:hypothetical protein
MTVAEQIIAWFPHVEHASVTSLGECAYTLTVGKMYDAPGVTFELMKAMSEVFGTDSIDVDNFAHSGCETCDYGSDYGHDIQLRNVTKRLDELDALVAQKWKHKGDGW